MPRVFAIGDLHLSLSVPNKAMDVFGLQWKDHAKLIREAWQDTVDDEDLVLIPGDISWAMYLVDALTDLDFVASLKGTKLLLRGNHDYWWQSVTQVRNVLKNKTFALQNDVFRFGNLFVCGTRGWTVPQSSRFKENTDRKLYERELIRLDLSLSGLPKDAFSVGMLHYPPFSENGEKSEFASRFEHAGVKTVVYGHLHGASHRFSFNGEENGVLYHLVSADYLHFIPKKILELS